MTRPQEIAGDLATYQNADTDPDVERDPNHIHQEISVDPHASSSSSDGENDSDHDFPIKPTPLPKFQLFIAVFVQIAEPVTCTVIYPLVNDLIRDLGITGGDETKTGYYVGVVVRFPETLLCTLS